MRHDQGHEGGDRPSGHAGAICRSRTRFAAAQRPRRTRQAAVQGARRAAPRSGGRGARRGVMVRAAAGRRRRARRARTCARSLSRSRAPPSLAARCVRPMGYGEGRGGHATGERGSQDRLQRWLWAGRRAGARRRAHSLAFSIARGKPALGAGDDSGPAPSRARASTTSAPNATRTRRSVLARDADAGGGWCSACTHRRDGERYARVADRDASRLAQATVRVQDLCGDVARVSSGATGSPTEMFTDVLRRVARDDRNLGATPDRFARRWLSPRTSERPRAGRTAIAPKPTSHRGGSGARSRSATVTAEAERFLAIFAGYEARALRLVLSPPGELDGTVAGGSLPLERARHHLRRAPRGGATARGCGAPSRTIPPVGSRTRHRQAEEPLDRPPPQRQHRRSRGLGTAAAAPELGGHSPAGGAVRGHGGGGVRDHACAGGALPSACASLLLGRRRGGVGDARLDRNRRDRRTVRGDGRDRRDRTHRSRDDGCTARGRRLLGGGGRAARGSPASSARPTHASGIGGCVRAEKRRVSAPLELRRARRPPIRRATTRRGSCAFS